MSEPVIAAGRVEGVVAVESDLLLTLILSIVADGTHRPVIDLHDDLFDLHFLHDDPFDLHDDLFDLLLTSPIVSFGCSRRFRLLQVSLRCSRCSVLESLGTYDRNFLSLFLVRVETTSSEYCFSHVC